MFDEKDIDMSDGHIDMPPLDQSEAEPVVAEDSDLPPELRHAQEMERNGAQQEQPVQAQQQQAAPQPQGQQEYEAIQARNFKAIKEAADRATRERDDLARKLQEYENAKVESQYEDLNIKEEDLVEGKHLVQAMKRIQHLEQQQKQYMKQSSETTAEMKLRQQYPDFDKVMTLENIQMLTASYPEIAESAIKGFGIYADKPQDADKKKVAANAAKPKPLASVSPQHGESPISRANAFSEGLTEARKEELRKEMDYYASMY